MPSGADQRATPLYSVGHRDQTMMQSCASAAKLRGGGPILENGAKPWPVSGDRHLGSSAETDDVLFVRLVRVLDVHL